MTPPAPWWGEPAGFLLLIGLPLLWATVRSRRAERRDRERRAAAAGARTRVAACRFPGCTDPSCPSRVVADDRRSA